MLLHFILFISFFYSNHCSFFKHNAYKRSSSPLLVKDANNMFFCSQIFDHCMKVKDFQIRDDEKFTCYDQHLPIKFMTKFNNGSSVQLLVI